MFDELSPEPKGGLRCPNQRVLALPQPKGALRCTDPRMVSGGTSQWKLLRTAGRCWEFGIACSCWELLGIAGGFWELLGMLGESFKPAVVLKSEL